MLQYVLSVKQLLSHLILESSRSHKYKSDQIVDNLYKKMNFIIAYFVFTIEIEDLLYL